jgi:hypothetical protein
MRFGAEDGGRTRPFRADPRKPEPSRIDQPHRVDILQRNLRLAPASIVSNRPEKTRESQFRLASAKVERFGATAPQW